MHELVAVRARPCACPDSPHSEEGDIVYLRPTLSMEGGIKAEQQMSEAVRDLAGDDSPENIRIGFDRLRPMWARTFIEDGAVAWNLVHADGSPVPFDVEVIVADWAFAREVVERASELYSDSIMDPFLAASGRTSPNGQTESSTSRRKASSRRQVERSSPATTDGRPSAPSQ